MEKETWKAGNMLYPLPAVMVSVSDGEGNDILLQLHGQELSARIRRWCLFLCDHPVFPMICSERRENL